MRKALGLLALLISSTAFLASPAVARDRDDHHRSNWSFSIGTYPAYGYGYGYAAPYDYGYAVPYDYGYNYGYSAPYYGYGYSAPAYGYGYSAPYYYGRGYRHEDHERWEHREHERREHDRRR